MSFGWLLHYDKHHHRPRWQKINEFHPNLNGIVASRPAPSVQLQIIYEHPLNFLNHLHWQAANNHDDDKSDIILNLIFMQKRMLFAAICCFPRLFRVFRAFRVLKRATAPEGVDMNFSYGTVFRSTTCLFFDKWILYL